VGSDRNLLVGWERSAGLRAPLAPEEGRLAANGTGYLLAVGPLAQRLYPRASALARWLSLASLPVVASLPFLLVPAPYGALGVTVLGVFACWLPRRALGTWARARLARLLERTPIMTVSETEARISSTATASVVDALAASAVGQLVRVEGIVAPQATVPSLFGGHPVVLATSDCAGVVETRGIDFDVRLSNGQLVRVPARESVLLGRATRVPGPPSCGPLTFSLDGGEPRLRSALLSADGWIGSLLRFAAHELTLGPGDSVELCGVIDLEPDEDARRGFARGPALRPVMRASDGCPVVIRKREASSDKVGDGASKVSPGTVTSAAR
jgi:hypothetical protein